MDVNAALEVLIGLAAMYLLLALICTIVNEIIANILELRAKNLKSGLQALLHDANVTGLANDVLKTPVIKKAFDAAKTEGPSYMASRQFASGVLEYVSAGRVPAGATTLSPADLFNAIAALPDSEFKTRLTTFAREAEGELGSLHARVSQWYDDFMDRWSGVYKRKIQKISFVVAVVLVAAMNADTFEVGKRLWADPALRAQAVALGEGLATKGEAGALDNPQYAEIRKQLQVFPLGWDLSGSTSTDKGASVCGIALKIAGLLFSAFAVALGAPFWFDVLNRLNAIRGAGKKPEAVTGTS